jgi:hypothetical protein
VDSEVTKAMVEITGKNRDRALKEIRYSEEGNSIKTHMTDTHLLNKATNNNSLLMVVMDSLNKIPPYLDKE